MEGTLVHQQSGREIDVVTKDLSLDGAFCRSGTILGCGDAVRMELSWPFQKKERCRLEADARIVRTEILGSEFGIALEFDSRPALKGSCGELGEDQSMGIPDLLGASMITECALQGDSRLQKVKRYIDERISQRFSLEQAAGIASMERTYFSEVFHKKLGMTFRRWLQCVRLAKALDLITKRNYSVAEIAYAVGFEDPGAFTRVFKRNVGLTPIEFKRMASGGRFGLQVGVE